MPQRPKQDEDALNEVLEALDAAERHHIPFREEVESSYRAYRGDYERTADYGQWTSNLHPPYIQHQVEVTVASLVDNDPKWFVDALPRMASDEETALLEEGSDALEKLLRLQMFNDRFKEKLRPALLQDAVAGVTPFKVIWRRVERNKMSRSVTPNDDGTVFMGEAAARPVVEVNQPIVIVKDIRDWMWPEAAVSVEKAEWIIDRNWLTHDELVALAENNGAINKAAVGRTDPEPGINDDGPDRDQTLWGTDRTKDRHEVLEYWTDDYLITVVDRTHVIQNVDNPYWHGRKPFVTMATQSELFRIPGTSQVKKVAHLQEMLWSLQNQRIDNLTLLNNAIAMIRSDVDDEEQFVFAPQERWIVEDPSQVVMWSPNPLPAQLSIPAEGLVKGDLQNLAGSFPFSSATDSQTIDQETATGAAIISNIAQRSLAHKKAAVDHAFERIGQMMVELNQQFVDEETLIRDIGIDDEFETVEITPAVLQGEYKFRVKLAEDSLMRNEKRQEATQKLQMALQVAPVAAQLSQMGAARMINLDAFVKAFLEEYGEDNPERFFVSQAPAGPPGMGLPGQSGVAAPGSSNGVSGPSGPSPSGQPVEPMSAPGGEAALAALLQQTGVPQ